MANLVRSRSWGRVKPPAGAQIDWGHPLAQGLELCVLGDGVDLVRQVTLKPNGSAARNDRRGGMKLASASSDFFDTAAIPDSPFIKASGLSLLWAGVLDTGSVFHEFAIKGAGNGGANSPFSFRTSNAAVPLLAFVRANGSGFFSFDSSASISLGVPHQTVITLADNLTPTTPLGYIDAVATTMNVGNATGSGAVTGTSANLRLGRRADGATQLNGTTDRVLAWSRPLRQDEIRWLRAEPNAFMAPPAPRIFYLALGSVTPALVTGTAAVTLAAFTSTATGGTGAAGTSAQTLAAFMSTASGSSVTGTSAQTLGAFTSTASGATGASGASAQTLAAFTSSASGAVGAAGLSSQTLDPFTSSATGGTGPVGTLAVTLAAMVSAASGSSVVGTAATVLAAFTCVATGTAPITATERGCIALTATDTATVEIAAADTATVEIAAADTATLTLALEDC